MNTEEPRPLDALVQERLDADTDFNDSLADLEDDEREEALAEKKKELTESVVSDLQKERAKEAELARNYKTRAEKAEGKRPKEGEEGYVPPTAEETSTPAPKGDDLSGDDIYALVQAQVHKDDVAEVKKAAKLLGKSIPEALEDSMVQSIIAKRVEKRATADATNTRPARGGAKKATTQEILDRAAKGDIPKPGTPEADDLFWARRGGRPS